MMALKNQFNQTAEHYARMAMNPGSIDHARHMVKEMEKDRSGMWVGLAKAVANKIEELKNERTK
jgi:hypothetical protein